jgi:hypothetical protein
MHFFILYYSKIIESNVSRTKHSDRIEKICSLVFFHFVIYLIFSQHIKQNFDLWTSYQPKIFLLKVFSDLVGEKCVSTCVLLIISKANYLKTYHQKVITFVNC